MNLHVISPGPLTTVQDAGRTGYAARGFRTCGAADGYAMRTANLLAGNPQAAGAAVLEMTLQGGKYQFDGDAVFALAGADMPAALSHDRKQQFDHIQSSSFFYSYCERSVSRSP